MYSTKKSIFSFNNFWFGFMCAIMCIVFISSKPISFDYNYNDDFREDVSFISGGKEKFSKKIRWRSRADKKIKWEQLPDEAKMMSNIVAGFLQVDSIDIFGSYAYGTHWKNSDLDLAIYREPNKKDNEQIKRLNLLFPYFKIELRNSKFIKVENKLRAKLRL